MIAGGDLCQLPPVNDLCNAVECPRMRNRAFFRDLCDSARLRLHICRRSDPALFEFYSQLSDSEEDVALWAQRAIERFPTIAGPCPINLVFSHKDRVRLNDELQSVYKPSDRPCFWAEPGPCRAEETLPQAMWLYEGLELYACMKARPWRNRWPYRVVEVEEKTVTLQAKDREDRSTLPHATAAVLFRLGFARSYHAAQGLEWPRVRLHGWSNPYFTLSHLLVGVSRCLRSDALDLGPA